MRESRWIASHSQRCSLLFRLPVEEMSSSSTLDFYEQFCPWYHLIFEDWDAAIDRQGRELNQIIRTYCSDGSRLLDVSCGIGTQAIGLAKEGYRVTASDLSVNAVERAKREAERRGQTEITFSVGDMREVSADHRDAFDLVISCDNSLPHLLTDDDILSALKAMFSSLRPGGACLITIRDYDQEQRSARNLVKPYGKAKIEKNKRYIAVQVWDFDPSDERYYDFTLYIVEEDCTTKELQTHAMHSRYYAITSERLIQLMEKTGFEHITRLTDVFYQPVFIGKRPLEL